MTKYENLQREAESAIEQRDFLRIREDLASDVVKLLEERYQLREALQILDDAFCSNNDTFEERHQSRMALIHARAALALGEQNG